MRIQDDMKLVSGDYAVHLDLIAKVRGMNSAEKFFEDLPDNMRDHTTCTSLLHTYVQYKDLAKSEALMKKMSECGFLKCPLPYNHLLSLYISMGKLEKVPELLQELLKNTSPDVVTYNLWLSVCAAQNEMETAEKIVLAMKKKKIDPDWVTHSTLANVYIKSSLKDKAVVTLKEMEKAISEKDRVAYASLISLHRQLQNEDEVVRIWKKMKSIFKKLNDAEYNCMISSLLKLDKCEEAEKLYAEWESVSPTRDARISNLLLADYINDNLMEKAENFHEQAVEKGVPPSYTTWELFTWGYLKQKQVDKALDCFKKMVNSVKRWDPDKKMIRKLFEFMEEHGNTDGAEKLLVMLRHAGYITTEIYNSLLRTYAKAGKMPLIVAERMKQDNVQLDGKTHELIALTSKMCVSDVPSSLS
ncbi:hypothetical protein Leryth_005513 [Lithospermum erythrorhizon]|nr:hypothetical protein Leryth_005513 [Lithospermum erythrorhizon]